MEKKYKGLLAVMIAALVLALNVVSAAAEESKASLIIANGTGGEITELVILPSREQYPGNRNSYVIDDLKESDGAFFAVTLPDQLSGIESFDIEIVSGGKRYVTRNTVKINCINGKTPALNFDVAGTDKSSFLIRTAGSFTSAAFMCAYTMKFNPKMAVFFLAAGVVCAGFDLLNEYVFTPGELLIQVDYN